ncbi:hypothetical protein [Roseobacter litoralis]|uniref:hypothetical protein n=1 Tax=Roseobacter litoralis TaxID=42443 RepID=UPI002495A6BB|nr:hypothetical protein [Roseobacter litoralis]
MIRSTLITATAAALLLPLPLSAQGSLKVGVQNMRLAMELCLRNYRTKEALQPAFENAGFELRPSIDPEIVDFQAPGLAGGFRHIGPQGYCNLESPDVPVALAQEMSLKLSESLFPGKVVLGSPEKQAGAPSPPCEGLTIFATQTLILINYSSAGNSGDCVNDGTSLIQIQM